MIILLLCNSEAGNGGQRDSIYDDIIISRDSLRSDINNNSIDINITIIYLAEELFNFQYIYIYIYNFL